MSKKSYKKKYAYGTQFVQPDYSGAEEVRSKGAATDGALTGVAGMIGGSGPLATAGSAAGGIAQKAIGTYDDGSPKVSGAALGSGLKYAGQGASIGMAAGPIGAVVGGVVGGAYGALKGGTEAKSIQAKYKDARRIADAQNKQNQYAATEIDQVGYAEKGLDMTKSKYKSKNIQKYPGGTSSVTTPTAKFTQAELENLNMLKKNPAQYKEALQGAIGYKPKYINPKPGTANWQYENKAYDDRVNAFNKRDMTKSPVNFNPYLQKEAAKDVNLNVHSVDRNRRLSQYQTMGGGQVSNMAGLPASKQSAMPMIPQYPDGTAAIKLQDSEIKHLRGIADPMQKRQALWDIMGYAPKNYPAGSEGYKRQEEMYNTAVNYVSQGYRPFSTPKGKGYEKVYSKGVKNVEVEKDEIVMAKTPSGKYKLKADFKGGKTHEQGGEPYVATEGEVIFPSNKRGEVVKAVREGNDSKLEAIRKTLPTDSKKKYAYGSKGVNPDYGLGKYKNKGIDAQIPLSGEPVQTGGMYTPRSFSQGVAVPASNSATPAAQRTGFDMGKLGSAASTMGEIAPIAYNIGQGLFGKAEKTNRRTYNPSKYTYQDNSEPLRNAANTLYNQDKQLIRNASGGNAGTYLSNVGIASANKFKRLQDINNTEAGRKVDVANANVDVTNQAQMANLNLNNQYDQLDLQNKARKDDYLSAGLGQLSDFSQKKALERNLKNNDEIRLGTLETTNYEVDKKTYKSKLKKYNKGVKSIKMKKC